MFSQRYPDMFDGIVAGNPGMDLPKAAVAEAWDSQAFAAAARALTPVRQSRPGEFLHAGGIECGRRCHPRRHAMRKTGSSTAW